MHDADWHDGWASGSWWLAMALIMIAFWGGLVWIALVVLRRGAHAAPGAVTTPATPPPVPRLAAEEILDERLARGEIGPDEYSERLDALRAPPPPTM